MRRRATGFTLVEVLIASSLLALLLLGLMGTISSFGRSSTRLEALAKEVDEVRLVSGFLRQTLGSATAGIQHVFDDGISRPWFIAGADSVEWLGVLPARHGVGGLHRLRLSLRAEHGGDDLLLQYQPYVRPDPLLPEALPDWSAVGGEVLARDIDSLTIRYQGVGEEAWLDEWGPLEVLPLYIHLQLHSGGRPWPVLIVALAEAEAAAAQGVIR